MTKLHNTLWVLMKNESPPIRLMKGKDNPPPTIAGGGNITRLFTAYKGGDESPLY